jgi:hypothetical protein
VGLTRRLFFDYKKQRKGMALCVELAENKGFSEKELSKIIKMVADNEEEFKTKYRAYIR